MQKGCLLTSYKLAIHNLHSIFLGQTACLKTDTSKPLTSPDLHIPYRSVLVYELGKIRIAEVGVSRTALVCTKLLLGLHVFK